MKLHLHFCYYAYQSSFKQTKLPDEWKHACLHYATPIFKEGEWHGLQLVVNYRLVSLTHVCCKTLEHIIYSFIMAHLDQCKTVIFQVQHYFCKQCSCETQLLLTLHDFNLTGSSWWPAGCSCSRFLESIWLGATLEFMYEIRALWNTCICTYFTLAWNFLSGRTQQVTLNGYHSNISCQW